MLKQIPLANRRRSFTLPVAARRAGANERLPRACRAQLPGRPVYGASVHRQGLDRKHPANARGAYTGPRVWQAGVSRSDSPARLCAEYPASSRGTDTGYAVACTGGRNGRLAATGRLNARGRPDESPSRAAGGQLPRPMYRVDLSACTPCTASSRTSWSSACRRPSCGSSCRSST